MFAKFQGDVQKALIESLVPDDIARQVFIYMSQFARRAGRLGWTGLSALFVTALGLVFIIDRAFNAIWRVQRPRALAQRILIYWAVLTMGPLLVVASVALSSWFGQDVPGYLRAIIDFAESALAAFALAAIYHFVPNTRVKWAHAWTGAIFATAVLEVAKSLLAYYLKAVPTYSAIYGPFATLPILMVWIYVAWVIVLLGAVVAAYLPSLLMGVGRRPQGAGWQFQMALDMLRILAMARRMPGHGLSLMQMAKKLRIDPLQLEPLAELLEKLDWVGRLAGGGEGEPGRWVLLADPEKTLLAPMMEVLLLPRERDTEPLWRLGRLQELYLQDVLTMR
jgi:membrane protein